MSILPSYHEVADIAQMGGFEDAGKAHKVQVEVQAEAQT